LHKKKLAQQLCKNFATGKLVAQFLCKNKLAEFLSASFFLCKSCRFLLFYFIVNGWTALQSNM